MKKTIAMLLCLLVFVTMAMPLSAQYKPTWESLDSRPNPTWYDEAKFGIFMHWGVYSVPSFGSEWFWKYWHDGSEPYVNFMKKNYPPGFSYAEFAPMFNAEFFDPDIFSELVAKSGAKYFVLTSKHHEGWTNWRSNVSWNWNSVDNGPHRDLIGKNYPIEYMKITQPTGKPVYGLKTDTQYTCLPNRIHKDILMPQLYDMVNTYKPEYIWSDGDWDAPDSYWDSKQFLAWLYNQSPVKDTILVNDRWGSGCMCHHGSVYTCSDRYNPGHLVKHKWENAMTVDKMSWGFRRNMDINDMLTTEELIAELVSTVSCGGNMLMNVGPTADGTIIPAFQERLLQMGEWLGVNGEAIYSTKPWRAQNDTDTKNIWYTSTAHAVYASTLDWPSSGSLILGVPYTQPDTQVTMLGYPGTFKWTPGNKRGIAIEVPPIPVNKLPTRWAWVFKLVNVS